MKTLKPQEHTVTLHVSPEGLESCQTNREDGTIVWHEKTYPHLNGGMCAFAEKNHESTTLI